MIKLNYKGKLSKDIENANQKYYLFGDNILMFGFDVILSMTSAICGYKFGRENINAVLFGLEVFAVSGGLTLFKGIVEKRRVDNERKKSISRIRQFSRYLKSNRIDVDEVDLIDAVVTSDKLVDSNNRVLDRVVSYQLESRDKKRLLVEMKNFLASGISVLKIRASLQEQEQFKDIQGEDTGIYLVESYELTKGKAKTLYKR